MIFSLRHRVQTGAGAHPVSSPVGIGDFFAWLKGRGRESGHSCSYIAEVKNALRYTSTPQYLFMAWCLVKHRNKFTFLLKRKYKMNVEALETN
jgi:hypothetical protein